jgi:hypothetical protein
MQRSSLRFVPLWLQAFTNGHELHVYLCAHRMYLYTTEDLKFTYVARPTTLAETDSLSLATHGNLTHNAVCRSRRSSIKHHSSRLLRKPYSAFLLALYIQ